MIQVDSNALTEQNLMRLESSQHPEPNSQDSDAHNVLRNEQIHSFNEQQGMAYLEFDRGQDPNQWLHTQLNSQTALHTSRLRKGDSRPAQASSNRARANTGQLDPNLKLYQPLTCSSNDHPRTRFLSPGAPQDPSVIAKRELAEFNMSYSDGSSGENRRLLAMRNSEQCLPSGKQDFGNRG